MSHVNNLSDRPNAALEEVLSAHGVVTLVGDDHTTDDSTAHGAPEPADVIAHTHLYWSRQTAPGRTAAVVDSDDVDFTVPAR